MNYPGDRVNLCVMEFISDHPRMRRLERLLKNGEMSFLDVDEMAAIATDLKNSAESLDIETLKYINDAAT